MQLIKNEFLKLKRLKIVYAVLIISFIPFIFNTVAMVLSTNMSAWNYYFYVFNQYATLFPAVVFIFSGAFFNNEFQNKTTLNWFSYPQNNFKLILSKITATMLLIMFTCIINHSVHIITLFSIFHNEILISKAIMMFISLILYSFLVIITVPIAAIIMILTKNFLSVVLIGVGSIFITTIVLGAEVSLYFPFSFAWRLGLQTYEPSMGYQGLGSYLLGLGMLLLYITVSLVGLLVLSRRPRAF
ncbi:ABC transporter permease [Bacillus pseudomycoides]|uniref:ABC transporter permease n=1 Tax=Bacillus bingmayongensis TaxID=1150157 RepID=A0ABU5JSA6_9BACI|nr:ABC transporter permease [Bacillus pseudomycoides]